MRKSDLWTSVFWFCAGLLIVFFSPGLDLGTPSSPGSGFMPFLTGMVICVFSLVTFVQAFFKKHEKETRIWADVLVQKLIIVLFLLLIYVLLLKPVGYLICTFMLILGLAKFIAREGWVVSLITAVLGSSLSYLLFDTILNAYLPKGILGW